ncbi:unnamed protein product [Rotaria sp. Silwood1]|nr:unnamed protein product [Rotaria sp. Silwood1]
MVSAFIPRTENVIGYSLPYVKFTHLVKKYPNTLKCRCSKIGVAYETFVKVHVNFHQVCSSQFIKQDWIDSIFVERNTTSSTTSNIQSYFSFFWQVIAGFCVVSKSTWIDAIANFNASRVLTPMAVAEEVLRSQAQEDLRNHIYSAQTNMAQSLLALRRTTAGNQFVSALGTNFYLCYWPSILGNWNNPKMLPVVFNNCSCLNINGCPRPILISTSEYQSVAVPGMIIDCLIVDATLASTLECYYDPTCFRLLHNESTATVNLLLNDSNKYFKVNSTVQNLLDYLMIDELNTEIMFDSFYEQCNPAYCTYSYTHRFSTLFIITTIIGSFGALSFVLRLLAPFLAQVILRWKTRGVSNERIAENVTNSAPRQLTVINRVRHLPNFAYQQLSTLNIFESKTIRTRTNLTREYFLTRLFTCIFIIGSIGIGFYIFISEQNQVVTIMHLSLETYENLFNEYSTSIQCPCSQASVPYGAFINVTFVLHQVCSSDLVSPSWLHYLASFNPTLIPAWTETEFSRDFRLEGVSYFQLLATFCSLAKINIEDGQRIFTNTQFVNDQLLSRSIFVQQTEALAKSFINKTRNNFARILNWIDIAGSLNRFLTGTNFNFKITVSNDTKVNIEDVSLVANAEITHTSIFMTTPCSCINDAAFCFVKSLIYVNGSNFIDFLQVFDELDIGLCGGLNRRLRLLVPLIGNLILILIKKWRNRNIVDDHCQYTKVSDTLPVTNKAYKVDYLKLE